MAYARTDKMGMAGCVQQKYLTFRQTRNSLLRLVWWYNQLQLAPAHLKDIVQDTIVYENSNISKAIS